MIGLYVMINSFYLVTKTSIDQEPNNSPKPTVARPRIKSKEGELR